MPRPATIAPDRTCCEAVCETNHARPHPRFAHHIWPVTRSAFLDRLLPPSSWSSAMEYLRTRAEQGASESASQMRLVISESRGIRTGSAGPGLNAITAGHLMKPLFPDMNIRANDLQPTHCLRNEDPHPRPASGPQSVTATSNTHCGCWTCPAFFPPGNGDPDTRPSLCQIIQVQIRMSAIQQDNGQHRTSRGCRDQDVSVLAN